MEPVGLLLEDVRYTYPDGTRALCGLSAAVAPGCAVGLVGPNGAGKSTLLQAVADILEMEGRILVGDIEVTRTNAREVRRRVGLVFQDPDDQLFMPTVLEDVAFGPLNARLDEREAVARARRALDDVGFDEPDGKAPYHLSGGQKKLVSIATVLSMRPGMLLLDEPTGDLDHRARRAVIDILRALDSTRIIATHDLELLVEIADEVIVLDEGEAVAQGPMRAILSDRGLLAAHGLEMPHSLLHAATHTPPGRPHAHHHLENSLDAELPSR